MPVDAFRGAQFDAGLAWVQFPEGFGGLGLASHRQRFVDEELRRAGATPPSVRQLIYLTLVAPTILTHGSEALKQRLLRRGFTGEDIWCQLFSEPGAGSDLAGLACRANPEGDEWVVTGQKVWNSFAHIADRGLLLARTDVAAPKHRGLSLFSLDMHAPGVEVRSLRQMTGGAEFCEVYLTDVRIPDSDRVGAVGDGWRVANTTLSNERTMTGGGGRRRLAQGSGTIAEAVRIWNDEAVVRDAATKDRLMRLWTESEALRLTIMRASQRRKLGNPGPETSVSKVLFADLNQRIYELCIDLLGPAGQVGYDYDPGDDEPTPLVGPKGSSRKMFLRARANSIEGGTSEIQRNIIGERVLDLPPEPRTDRDLPWSEVLR